MILAILGRQPALGIAELERVYGGNHIAPLSVQSAKIDNANFNIQRFGGVLKAGKIIFELPSSDWQQTSQKIVQHYSNEWSSYDGKITLGISAYNFKIDSREVQKVGIILKQKLKKSGVSLRLVPNLEPALSTATSHHNKLGLAPNKVELIIIRTNDNKVIIAESTGSQNITAYANRDQERPKRDAFVGMLPPKLAQIMINLACGRATGANLLKNPLEPESNKAPGPLLDPERSRIFQEVAPSGDQKTHRLRSGSANLTILDPFCGTGVILQEAVLMGYTAYGTDLSEKMVSYSRDNLNWLSDSHHTKFDFTVKKGDAMDTKWQQPFDAVVSETYLGQPFSAPPSPAKLAEVVKNCDHIITEFLINLRPQIEPETPVCIAIPAWRDSNGDFTHLPLVATVARFGYKPHEFTNSSQNDLLYYRENQIVARELLVLTKV